MAAVGPRSGPETPASGALAPGGSEARSRTTWRAPVLGAVFLALLVPTGCANGGGDNGPVRDSCKLRDCGPAVGGDAGDLSGGDELPPDVDDPSSGPSGEDAGAGSGGGGGAGRGDSGRPSHDGGGVRPDAGASDSGAAGCGLPPDKACATIPQCGCEVGQSCDITSVSRTGVGRASCVKAGNVAAGHKCTLVGQCAKGLSCIFNLCQPFCRSSADCGGGNLCRAVQRKTTSASKDIVGYNVCGAQCDPRFPSLKCPTGNGCRVAESKSGTTSCAAAGTATGAGACASDFSACAPGYFCATTTRSCRKWCRIGFATDCPTGKACGMFSDHPVIRGVEYGICEL